jgi:predicted RNA-binding protein with RPS1 domain
MLRYVPGLRPEHVQPLCARRAQSPLASRADLRTLPGWDEPTFVTAAGFLRVHGDNPLDATRVHPESYAAAERLLEKVGHRLQDLKAPASAQAVRQHLTGIALEPLAAELNLPLPDLAELVGALQKPNADPRQQHHGPIFRNKMRRIEDLAPGMWVKGTVRNVVDFGAFVDIGLKEDGLIHISQFSKRYVRNPLKFLHVGDVVDARIVSINTGKHRIALTLISEEPKKGEAPPGGQAAARPARPRPRTGRRGPRPATAAPSAEGGPSAPAHGAPAPAPQRRAAAPPKAGGRRPPRAPQRAEGAPAQGEGDRRDRFRRGRRPTRTGPPRIIISKSQAELKDRGADEKGRPKIRWAHYESDPNEEEWVEEEAEAPAEAESRAAEPESPAEGETTPAKAESPAQASPSPVPAETAQPAAPATEPPPTATPLPQADPTPPQSDGPPNNNV